VTITVPPTVEPIGRLLTAQEYDALPENRLRELVDGVIHMMAPPSSWHQIVKDSLRAALRAGKPAALRAGKPAELVIVGEVEVRVRDDLRRIPDCVLVHRAAYGRERSRYLPGEVALVVEVVSPGSESTDRILKPIEYAHAGIGHFWRVEIEPEIVVRTYRLAEDRRYLATGAFRAGQTVRAPGLEWAAVQVDGLADEG
jgi:Uma2 family endonuclease